MARIIKKPPFAKSICLGQNCHFYAHHKLQKFQHIVGGKSFNIEKDPEFIEGASSKNNASVSIYSSGWEFFDRVIMGTPYGGLLFDVVLLRNLDSKDESTSLIKRSNFESWVLETNELRYGSMNKDMIENPENYAGDIVPDEDFFQYPKMNDDLQWFSSQNQEWVCYEVFQPGSAADTEFETVISNNHVIRITWSPSSFEMDYFSPNHNLRAATKVLMDTIMSSMKIELSAEAKQQFIEVENI